MINAAEIEKAVAILAQGGLVAIPTETVYGLGADASNPEAVRKIFAAKGRPADHPLIVHVGDAGQIADWAVDISPKAWQLAKAFWPGPLTLILKKAPHVSDLITGGQDTIGLRVPNHAVALAVLQGFGGGVAAPSANRFGRISPTTAGAVFNELGESVDLILEGGQCEVGVESTIVDMSSGHPVILRPGMITAEQIAEVLDEDVLMTQKNSPRVSGALDSHYAPVTPTRLVTVDELLQVVQGDERVGVLSFQKPLYVREGVRWVEMSADARMYAHDLYAALRGLDELELNLILVEHVPEGGEWVAVKDRLRRACSK